HDHKYDPISQKEYFQFFAFFDDIDELGVASHFGTAVPTPALALPSPDTEQQLSELSSKTAILLRTLLKAKQEIGAETLKAWYRTTEEPHMGLDSAVAFNLREAGSSEDGRGRFFDGDSIAQTELGAVTRHDPFSISFWMRAEAHKERVILCHLSDHWTDAASRGWELAALDGKLRFSMIHFWPGNAMSIETNQAIAEQEWTHVALSYDGSSQASGMRLYVNGVVSETRVVRDQLTKQITYKDFGNDTQGVSGVRWGGRARDHGFKNGRIADASFFEHVLHPFEVAALFDPSRLDGFSGRAFNRLSSVELSYLKHLYALKQSPVVSQYEIALRDARAAYGDLQDDVPEILTMRETDAPKQAYLLERGLYSERGAEVFPETPASLPPMKPDLPKNRLGLAQWLLEPENPLFARVAVNRFWALCFGNGLVETAEDFGLQGDQPHYPDLLDQLAREFRKSEWNVKALMRQIVTSKTYRQRSIAAPELMHDDPANRLLARGPSHRLPGEMIRDSALAASGLLLKASHAAPRRPYDLSEAFVPMEVSEGAGLYHRSVYSLWKRSAPSPVMMAFDGVKRDVCSARRITTNTPLQSLVLLNGPQFVEAARVASEVVMKDVQGDSIDLIQQLSLRFISREPQGEEMRILQQLYREQLRHFKQNPEAAEALLNVGNAAHTQTVSLAQHAAAVVLAQTLMNFDEAVMKR
ncbi:MAG TPA: hypothetical protein DCX06_11725, partial [Opitutae bacterium]|nr:hypothetical protein [Opitutae bacterium]